MLIRRKMLQELYQHILDTSSSLMSMINIQRRMITVLDERLEKLEAKEKQRSLDISSEKEENPWMKYPECKPPMDGQIYLVKNWHPSHEKDGLKTYHAFYSQDKFWSKTSDHHTCFSKMLTSVIFWKYLEKSKDK